MLADGILVREDLRRQPLADHDPPLWRRLTALRPDRLVALVEHPAAAQRQPDGLEVRGRHHAPSSPGCRALLSPLRRRGGVDVHARIASLHRPMAHGAGRDHLGQGRKPFEEAVHELLADAVLVVGVRHAQREHETVFGLESSVDGHQLRETANEEPGAHEQDEREGDFAGDERRAEASLPAAVRLTVSFAERADDTGRRRLQRGSKARKQPGRHSDEPGESEHPKVQIGIRQPWDAGYRGRSNQAQSAVREGESQRHAEPAEQERLHQDEAHEARAACAERGANGDLALPGRTARQQQVRDVQARDQQQEA